MTRLLKVLNSQIDGSINHLYSDNTEFRVVSRADHDTIYLSSHTGCGLGCQMCWLTATEQTEMRPLGREEMLDRATRFLSKAKGRLNWAFMARGDALANPNVDGALVEKLISAATPTYSKICISTIFPKKAVGDEVGDFLLTRFGGFQPHIFWSVYSLDSSVRAAWLPQAQDPSVVAWGLVEWQKITGLEIIVHHALIDGVNSDTYHAYNIAELMKQHSLRYRVNLVRYNAPPGSTQKEASEEDYRRHRAAYAAESMCSSVRIQPRVGVDVAASCGMFLTPDVV